MRDEDRDRAVRAGQRIIEEYDDRIYELKKALEYYANPSDYKSPFNESKLFMDCGMVAKEALSNKE